MLVTCGPLRGRRLASGATEPVSSGDIPGEIVDVVVADEAFLNQHPDLLRHLLRGRCASIENLQRRPEDTPVHLGKARVQE